MVLLCMVDRGWLVMPEWLRCFHEKRGADQRGASVPAVALCCLERGASTAAK